MATKNSKKNEEKYCCIYCDFNTCKITDYKRHLDTKKHIGNTMATSGNENLEKVLHKCENCNKTYNDRTGLWKHKKKCINYNNSNETNQVIYDKNNNSNEFSALDLNENYVNSENDNIKSLNLHSHFFCRFSNLQNQMIQTIRIQMRIRM